MSAHDCPRQALQRHCRAEKVRGQRGVQLLLVAVAVVVVMVTKEMLAALLPWQEEARVAVGRLVLVVAGAGAQQWVATRAWMATLGLGMEKQQAARVMVQLVVLLLLLVVVRVMVMLGVGMTAVVRQRALCGQETIVGWVKQHAARRDQRARGWLGERLLPPRRLVHGH